MKKIILSCLLLCSAVLVTILTSFQQQPVSRDKNNLTSEDSAALNALVMYPDTIRIDIFEACVYPASIVNVASLQKNSSINFANLVSAFTKEEQEDYWNLSRYPNLISKLVKGGKKSPEQINSILAEYPSEIHDKAFTYGMNHYDMLLQIDELQDGTNVQFEKIISDYPNVTQDALRELIQYPEIITLLDEHLSLAVRAGDHYRRDPQGVIRRADSINIAETRQNAEDAATWKEEIQNNPDVTNDLKNAANDYAQENGYTQEEINTPPPASDYVSNYTCYPYSYWFGYPVWYPYQYWYPYPYWFDCGFYYDNFGNMVIIGYPSFYFTNWYFYYPDLWHHYPHLCDSYIKHYYGPHRLVSSNNVIVHRWVHDNKNYLPADFITNNKTRAETIKQVGQLHMDLQNQLPGKPITSAIRDQYLKNNAIKYPALNANPQPKLNEETVQPNSPVEIQPPVKQPSVHINKQEQQSVPVPQQETKVPQYDFNKINKAQEYHRNIWEQAQPSVRPQPQSPSRQQLPARQVQPQHPVQQHSVPHR